MAEKRKLTLADFPDEPHLNQTDLEYRQAALDAQVEPETPAEIPAPKEPETPVSSVAVQEETPKQDPGV